MEGQDHRQRRAALDHRHAGQPRQHAEGGFRQMGDAAGTGRGDPVSRQRRSQRRHRRTAAGERTGLGDAPVWSQVPIGGPAMFDQIRRAGFRRSGLN